MADSMRSRFLNKMTNEEVEEYLNRNDIIFIPVGTVEAHGRFPLDIELTVPEALSLKMAEKVDGLVFGSLPYFFCGATTIGRGTVQMSIQAGVKYLKEIAYSLLSQGFRRQIYVSAHGPAFLTAGTVVIDFFDETKCPITYMDMMNIFSVAQKNNPNLVFNSTFQELDTMTYGAYRILDRLKEIIIDPGAEVRDPDFDYWKEDNHTGAFSYLFEFGHPSGTAGFYLSSPEDHGGRFGAVRSAEELDIISAKGEKLMCDIVDSIDVPKYVAQMRALDEYTQTDIKKKYGKHLPKNKFSEWI